MNVCSHGNIVGRCPFDVECRTVAQAWFTLAGRYLPLTPRVTMHASPEAVCQMSGDLALATYIDPSLHGLEMRLEDRR